MKKQIFAAISLCLFLTSALFIQTGNAIELTSLTLQSSGTILQTNAQTSKPEFLIRYVWIGSVITANEVDAYVASHPWGTGIIFTDLSSGILSVISYTGWNASETWQKAYGGISYAQLKTVIDEFHKLGWKVIYSPGNTPTSNDRYFYNYLTQQHPELIAVAGNGSRYDQIHSENVMVNFFANYTTPDASRNINTGDKLSDLYIQRLTQMVTDESFQWDGWFGVDGWNGFTNQGLYWVWSTNQPFGRWIGTNDLSKWYYGDNQSILEWTQSAYAKNLPTDWNIYTTAQRISWITNNANIQWWEFWQDRFAQLYAQINNIFDNRPSDIRVGTILAQDLSSTWADNGINNPTGMENLTMFAQYDSFSHYYIDSEWWGNLDMAGRYSAYVAGLVKSKIPTAHCISQMPIAYSGTVPMPTWVWKQMYLSMIQTYSWNNGVQYRAVDPDWLLVWAPVTQTWSDAAYHGQEMADWVTNIAATMNHQISPTWLGPVDIQPLFFSGTGMGGISSNFTFAQFTDALNINITSSNIVPQMGTVFLDAIGSYGTAIGGNAYQTVLDLFANGSLNVIYNGHGSGVSFNSIFMGQGDTKAMTTFNLKANAGTSYEMTTLSSEQVSDPYARAIIGETFGQKYVAPYYGVMQATAGTVPLVTYNDGGLALGLFYNESSGRFLYGKELSGNGYSPAKVVSREVINRGIYWVSNCPVKTSDELADLKIFEANNGCFLIPIMNLRNFYQNMSLSLNLTGLNLNQSPSYTIKWAGAGNQFTLTDLSDVQVTLVDGADVLVISPNS